MDYGVTAGAKNTRHIVRRIPVHSNAKRVDTLKPRFGYSLPRIFDAVAAFIKIHIVGLAI